MSRIDTQSDRLQRGAGEFERQRSFVVQPERFASTQNRTASQLLSALGQTVGVVADVRAEGQRRERELREQEDKAAYNSTVSNLSTLQKQLDADPTNQELLRTYSETLTASYNTFDESTDNGVSLRRSFPIPAQMQEHADSVLASAAKAVQGGYIQSADRLAVVYETQEELTRVGSMHETTAVSTVFRELLDSYSQADRERMTPETLDGLLVKSYKIVGKSRDIYKTNQSIKEERMESAAMEGLVNESVARGQAPTLISIIDHATLYNKPDVEVISEVGESLIDNFETALLQGNQNELQRAYTSLTQLEESLGEAYPSERLKLVESINQGVELVVSQDSALFKNAVDDTVETAGNKDILEGTLDNLSVTGFNTKFGTTWTVDRPEEIPPENTMQERYLEGMIKAKKSELGRYKESIDTVGESVDVLLRPSGSRTSDVNKLVDLARPERGALIENLISIVAESGESEEEITNQVALLLSAKEDNAAWYEVLASQFRDTDQYTQVFKQTVSKNLDGPVSQDGLRQVIAFVGSDVEDVVHLFDDKAKINALTQTMIDSDSNPEIDLVDTYNRHLSDYQSIRFKEKSGDKEGISFTELLQNGDFLKAFTGEPLTSLSTNTAETLAAIINVGAVDAGNALPDAMAKRVDQLVKDRGYYLVKQEREGGGLVVSLVSHTTIPEAAGLDSIKVADALLKDSRASQYFGSQLNPQGNQSVREMVLDKIKTTPYILQNPAFSTLVTQEALDSHIENGNLKIIIDTPNASRQGVPVFAVLSDQNGLNPIPIPLGEANFNDSVVSNSGPDFLKDRTERQPSVQHPLGKYHWMR